MKCSNCGFEFNEGLFCPECGTKCEKKVGEPNINLHEANAVFNPIENTETDLPSKSLDESVKANNKKEKADNNANKSVGLMILAIIIAVGMMYLSEYKLHIPDVLRDVWEKIAIIVPLVLFVIAFFKALFALFCGTDNKKRCILVILLVTIVSIWVYKIGSDTIEAKKNGTFEQYQDSWNE